MNTGPNKKSTLGHERGKILVFPYFLLARLILILSLPLDGVKSYGDFWNFFHLGGLGRPFWDLWIEFPPLFPFLSRGIYVLAGGQEHAYIYLLVLLFSLAQAGSIFLFQVIAEDIWGLEKGLKRTFIYAFLLLGLFYGWSYFDSLGVFLGMLGLYLLIESKGDTAGLVLGLGGLVKWFPVLILPAGWKWLGWRKGLRLVLGSLLVLLIVWGALYLLSPEMTQASILSQGAKGSWESLWAILDGNLRTGNFPPGADRTNPSSATLSTGNPAVISPWITLLLFAGIGIFFFIKADLRSERHLVAFSGLTLVLFFLWSPGYSPQWVLYLLPLILLSFEGNRAVLFGLTAILVNLLEWPTLLSRGLFQYLPFTIMLRSFIYLILAAQLAGIILPGKRPKEMDES